MNSLSFMMESASLFRAWRRLLPIGVEISCGPYLDSAPPLAALESVSAGVVDQGRLLELRSGRAYAKRALAALGFCDIDLPIGGDRAPVWPKGVTGSIAHTTTGSGHVVAAVARESVVGRLGIDVETEGAANPRTWAHFLSPAELAELRLLPIQARSGYALNLWCVKEATTKAMQKLIVPTEIEVRRGNVSDGPQIMWRVGLPRARGLPEFLVAQTIHSSGFILGAVVVR